MFCYKTNYKKISSKKLMRKLIRNKRYEDIFDSICTVLGTVKAAAYQSLYLLAFMTYGRNRKSILQI